MDKWLKKTVEIDNDESTVNQNQRESNEPKPSTSKRRKVLRKYDHDYLKMGFTWNEDEQDPRPRCIICYDQLANESMRPNKLLRHFESKHSELKNKPLDFLRECWAG